MRVNGGRPARPGLTLLELMIALALLGLGAAAWAGLLAQGIHTTRGVRARDAEVNAAAEELARVAVWSPDDFASRVGRREARGFVLVVEQRAPDLYDVAIADTIHGTPILQTSFYIRSPVAPATP